ncbi:hypothetical protein MASR2M70_08510 [Bacillota bacterium]
MNTMELGKIIKEARISKRMTQSEVVGDFITRNMLSQIESGSAMPSVKTLEYLSGVLDLPFHQLSTGHLEDNLSMLINAKELLSKAAYEEVIVMENDYPPRLSEEFFAIFSHAFLNLAKASLDSEDYTKAAALSQKAIEYSEKGIYANATVKSESIMVLNQAAEKLSLYYKNLSSPSMQRP